MFESLFDYPLWIAGTVIIGSLCLFAAVGLLFVRRRVLPRLRIAEGDSEFTGAMMQSVMVFYGLAAGLIAVSVWQTYTDVQSAVSAEATSLAAIYRDVSSYPDSVRPHLQQELREYTRYVIEEAWPLQQRGQVPGGGVERMNRFQSTLVSFEPATEGQKLLHAETLRAYNEMIKARRSRLDTVSTGLSGVVRMGSMPQMTRKPNLSAQTPRRQRCSLGAKAPQSCLLLHRSVHSSRNSPDFFFKTCNN